MNDIQSAYAAAYRDGAALCQTDAYSGVSNVPEAPLTRRLQQREEIRSAAQGCGSPLETAHAYIKPGMTVVDVAELPAKGATVSVLLDCEALVPTEVLVDWVST
jgi:hypothetical protein